jgi:hypothetical protein
MAGSCYVVTSSRAPVLQRLSEAREALCSILAKGRDGDRRLAFHM